jgi:hypothetical protein
MPQSPAKRRKTSPTTLVAIAVDATESTGRTRTLVSGHVSFQSPTKSSLSRSHPKILALSPSRRSSQGRGQGLREDVLTRKSTITSFVNPPYMPTAEMPQQSNDRIEGTGTRLAPSPPATSDSLSTAATRAFAPSVQAVHAQRPPLRPRQPSLRDQSEDPTKRGQVITGMANHDFPASQNDGTEPELPPTPTQLGLSPKPRRPRGLAASSSPSSRGSGRSRLRNGQVETSSPLKPKGGMAATEEEEMGEKSDSPLAEEAPESDAGQHVVQAEDDSNLEREVEGLTNATEVPENILTKRKVRDDVRSQLVRLQSEMAQLETALDAGADAEGDLEPHLLALLSTSNISCDPSFTDAEARPSTSTIKDPVALDINPLAFLRAFAPGDLRLTTTSKRTFLRGSGGKIHQAHILNISAPPPWPPHVFNATFRVTCDVEAKAIISITGANIRPSHGAGIKELRHWMEARLRSPLHKFDAGTLVWGLGIWWKEAVTRAQFFHHIDITKANTTTEPHTPFQPNAAVAPADVQALIPYIGKSFVELIPAEPYSNRASTNEARKYRQTRLLLKWDLELDWAGEVHTEIDVAGTKVSAQGQEGLKQVFPELMRRNGLGAAVRQIVRLCGGGVGSEKGSGNGNGNGKRKNVK